MDTHFVLKACVQPTLLPDVWYGAVASLAPRFSPSLRGVRSNMGRHRWLRTWGEAPDLAAPDQSCGKIPHLGVHSLIESQPRCP
jgi:hypothetical protein